jgi:hypothetical protein
MKRLSGSILERYGYIWKGRLDRLDCYLQQLTKKKEKHHDRRHRGDTFEVTTPSERKIRLTRLFNAPRPLVFEAMTRPEPRKTVVGQFRRRLFGAGGRNRPPP